MGGDVSHFRHTLQGLSSQYQHLAVFVVGQNMQHADLLRVRLRIDYILLNFLIYSPKGCSSHSPATGTGGIQENPMKGTSFSPAFAPIFQDILLIPSLTCNAI